ncbi:restriction endonuclease subunit S [Hoeflea sp. AS16]|uniref:restriction endonuclease subunit S n=1 Tax=Hoeflea sp. AS16 TaxID=3135779 RepID=UPI0031702A04
MSVRAARLGDVCEVNPRTPKGISDDTVVSFLPMSAVSEGGFVSSEETRTFGTVKKGYTYFERGDVLVAKITPCFENGKAAPTDKITNQLGFGSTEFHVVRPSREVDAKYVFYLLWNDKFRAVAGKGMTGSAGQKRVPADLLKRLEIPLPPLDEQKRIAAILDKADLLRQKRRQAIALLDNLTQSIFLEMFGDLRINERKWPVENLDALCKRITVGIVVKPASYYQDQGVIAIRSQNIEVEGFNLREVVYFSKEDNEGPLAKTRIFAGDVVIVRTGQPGKAAVVDHQLDGSNAIDVLIVTPDFSKIDPQFFSTFINSPVGKQIVLSEQRGQIQQHLNVGSLKKAAIPLPPLVNQQHFTAAWRKLRTNLAMSTNHRDNLEFLFASLQHRAFSGQL